MEAVNGLGRHMSSLDEGQLQKVHQVKRKGSIRQFRGLTRSLAELCICFSLCRYPKLYETISSGLTVVYLA